MAYSPSNRPRTPEEMFREIRDRLEALENAASVRVGGWGIKQDEQGRIVAVHAASGTTVVLAEPQAGGTA
ncbi:hypothetical protein [Amycolatopsis thermophila]|uniref:Uncharacterized protein n=1 Tax=Amycolatopsis thermophila TaxID=206084 RepID=A0ABU0EMH6_9PSEU|nr:hypothetical protein [Amycolatopsis thermophila]MDQ0376489.1 hypothetical protein [Amycolatopsis thermophila]